MAWEQKELFTGVLAEFAERQAQYGGIERLREHEARLRAWYLAMNRRDVAAWNARNAEVRKQRQRVYDARKNAKKKQAAEAA